MRLRTFKQTILAAALTFSALSASAATIQCTASVETTPGSNVYNKGVFSETRADDNASLFHYLLADGTVLDGKNATPGDMAKVQSGDRIFGMTFDHGKLFLSSGIVRRTDRGMEFDRLSLSANTLGISGILITNGLAIGCMPEGAQPSNLTPAK